MAHLVSLLTGLTAWIVTICVCIFDICACGSSDNTNSIRFMQPMLIQPVWKKNLISTAVHTTGLSPCSSLAMSCESSSLFNLCFVNLLLIQPSISLQIPANVVITRVRPAIMLPLVVTLWGAVVCFMALVKNHSALFGLRIVLGFTEAVCIAFKSSPNNNNSHHPSIALLSRHGLLAW